MADRINWDKAPESEALTVGEVVSESPALGNNHRQRLQEQVTAVLPPVQGFPPVRRRVDA